MGEQTVLEAVIDRIQKLRAVIEKLNDNDFTEEERDRAVSVVRMMGEKSWGERFNNVSSELAAVEASFVNIVAAGGGVKEAMSMIAMHGSNLYMSNLLCAFILGYLQGEKDSVVDGLNGKSL